jgi:uncharacterized membrane protein
VDDEARWHLFEADLQRITALDTIAVAIRGWAITLTSALAGFALSEDNRRLVLATVVVPVLFGVLDVHYRTTQLLHTDRSRQIERVLAPDLPLRPRERTSSSRSSRSSPSPGARRPELGRYRSAVSLHAVLVVVLLVVATAM